MVVVVDGDQVAELQVTSSGGSLAGNTLHSAAIAKEDVGVVVDEVVARLVEDSAGVCLGNGETNGVGEALAQRTSGDLNAGSVVALGMPWGDAVDLAELLQVVDGDAVAEEVQQGVVQHAAVAVGEDEAIAVEPLGVLGVEGHELVEQDVGDGGHAHGRTGVARVGLERGIDLERDAGLAAMRCGVAQSLVTQGVGVVSSMAGWRGTGFR